MICNQCGIENKEGSKFCSHCGTMLKPVQIVKSKTQKEETILKIFNCLIIPTLVSIIIYYLFSTFIVFLTGRTLEGVEINNNFESFNFESFIFGEWAKLLIFCSITMILILVVNIILISRMKKINKQNQAIGQLYVSKRKYIITALFLGYYGVYRFIAKDEEKRRIYRVLSSAGAMTAIIAFVLTPHILPIISSYLLMAGLFTAMIPSSLTFSDVMIAISKKADENGKIYI